MRKLIVVALVLSGGGACNMAPQKKNCQRLKTGSFSYHFQTPQGKNSFLVTRQGNTQTEVNQQTGATSTFAINWLNDCTYELHLLESTEHFPKEIEELRRNAPLKTEILGGTDAYYLFRSQRPGSDFVLSDTIWINK